MISLPDDLGELIDSRVLAGSHVGEEISVSVTLHDGETREGGVSGSGSWVNSEAEVIAAREDDISRRIINAGDHDVGGA